MLFVSRLFCVLAVGLLAWPGLAPGQETAGPANPYEGKAEVIDDGRSLFNQYCSHCHGPNAVQGERPRDLRRLKLRYGAEAAKVFYETVNTGIPDRGMPTWKGVLDDDLLWRIFTYLQSVQSN